MPSYLFGVNNKFGALNIAPFLPVPDIPTIITEWTAVIPLVCHLASYKRDYELVGQLSLSGRLSVGMFPKLGVLAGLSRLLERGPEFIDQASSKGPPSWRVWDICWGSIFPCANGGASAMIVRFVLGREKEKAVNMPDTIPTPVKPSITVSSTFSTLSSETIGEKVRRPVSGEKSPMTTRSISEEKSSSSTTEKSRTSAQGTSQTTKVLPVANGHRRFQTLHLLQFHRQPVKRSWVTKIDVFLTSPLWESFTFVFLIGIVVVLCLLGLYGTAIILLCGALSQASCRAFKVHRPSQYLEANEQEQESFMLVGLHQNTCTWYLFTGDRAIVDTLLNKTMVAIFPSVWRTTLYRLLRMAHFAQLLAMTFVAGQKGWDGVGLVLLMMLDFLWRWRYNDDQVVRRWMETEGVGIKTKSFKFTGRTMMIGAIHSLSGSNRTAWMDEILSPHPRRDAWLTRLQGLGSKSSCEDTMSNVNGIWSTHDWRYIMLSSELAHSSAEILKTAKSTKKYV